MSEPHKGFRSLADLKADPATRDEIHAILAELTDLAVNHDLAGGTDPGAEARALDVIERYVRLSERS